MARNINTIDYQEDYYKGLAKIYFNRILQTIIDFGDLKNEPGMILDYGCGVGHLKKKLNKSNVVGYDIIPELSDVDDYRNLKPQKIILSGVLEHLYLDEIDNLLKEFLKMSSAAELLVFLPTENFVSKISMHLSGQPHAHDDHVSKYKQINQLIEKYYYPAKRKYIFLRMAQVTKYLPIKNLSAENYEKVNFRYLPEFSIVILCYKEGNSVRQFVKRTIDIIEDNNIFNYELVLVGNYHEGSSDLTPKVVAELASQNSKISYVAKPKQGMMGWDMRSGLSQARGNYIAVIDGDGQMPVEDLVKVYRKIKAEKLDLVKTYRIERGDSQWRKFLNASYNLVFSILFPGMDSRDINSKPKIITKEVYQKLNLESNDWFIDAEIMIQARRLNLKIGEIPTSFSVLDSSRKSFVKSSAIFEFIKNLIIYRIKEFQKSKKI